jgi:phage antirepressor YoqD-like protein
MFNKETTVINGETVFTLNQAAKLLNFEIGRTRLMKLFRDWGLLLKKNEPSQSMIDRGYMLYFLKRIEKDGKLVKTVPVTLVTIQGLAYLKRIIQRKLKEKKGDGN